MKTLRRIMVSLAATAFTCTTATAPAAHAAVDPVLAAPYLYQRGNPIPNPVEVMNSTGIKSFTLAFVLSDGGCNPKWDGSRSLTGSDATMIKNIRNAGGDVVPSFGGWAGVKLGETCSSASALAGAYQEVIDAYQLGAIDVDIENTEFTTPDVQDRVLNALKIVKQKNRSIRIVVTMTTVTSGPEATGQRLIKQAKAIGADVDVWSIMPFNFSDGGDMAAHTESAAEGLKNQLKSVFGLTDDQAYRRMGISSMNGKTDSAGETVTLSDFRTIAAYAAQHHLARLTFWALNRDRGDCGSTSTDSCGGISQGTYDFTAVVAGHKG
jgi:chitinase